MGISGLLPALKSIQVTRHLEEYSGKTVAVDAYGWLHKGLYTCAAELATGKASHKYVDYAMHRVRLLKHYGIQPYIVFDGGPLPAKKGTENERKKKREENLAKGKALTAQGKHTQARECYIKSVDVTPQMAFQLIKALKAEGVPYVVAPYEADSQMAYLERAGITDAVLTEDSDLLVFGCKTVLYKFDAVANTVVSITRDNFGSVMASANDPSSISLYGWSDAQFRAMAILSGCDYLPSIPGIGLKTSNNLLRKWKTPEQVVKAIALEGKKSVPNGYWKDFVKAEKCFLHQRVYCPLQEKLVNLSEISGKWNTDWDAYVGSDIEQGLAKSIAEGNSCPISQLPMVDINPGFVPRGLKKSIPAVAVSPKKPIKAKGKARDSALAGGILNFFGPNPVIPARLPTLTISAPLKSNVAGKASGKRTLAEVMDQDIQRRKKRRRSPSPLKEIQPKQSRFFGSTEMKLTNVQRRHSEGGIGFLNQRDATPGAGPSNRHHGRNKENVDLSNDRNEAVNDEEVVYTSEPELDASDLSIRGEADLMEADLRMALDTESFPDVVEQEDGYISPSPRDACDLSSPIQTSGRRAKGEERDVSVDYDDENDTMGMALSEDEDREYDADPISSPISTRKSKQLTTRYPRQSQPTPTHRKTRSSRAYKHPPADEESQGQLLDLPTLTPTKNLAYGDMEEVPSPTLYRGPDLKSTLGMNAATELNSDMAPDSDNGPPSLVESSPGSDSASPPTPSPETPLSRDECVSGQIPAIIDVDQIGDYFDEEDEEEQRRAFEAIARAKAVKDGWRAKWALASKSASKNVTPLQDKKGKGNSASKSAKLPTAKRSRNPSTAKVPVQPAFRSMNLRRSDTNVTPLGRHSLRSFYQPPKSAPSRVSEAPAQDSVSHSPLPRTRLIFFEDAKTLTSTSRKSHTTGRQFVDLTARET